MGIEGPEGEPKSTAKLIEDVIKADIDAAFKCGDMTGHGPSEAEIADIEAFHRQGVNQASE